jgi:transcriptional regulator with XRE-family HTH domain
LNFARLDSAGAFGVIDMALLSVIRRWAFRDQLSIREISRRTGLSRNTIRKYLRAGSVEPKFKVPDRPSKLDAFADKLSGWLTVGLLTRLTFLGYPILAFAQIAAAVGAL